MSVECSDFGHVWTPGSLIDEEDCNPLCKCGTERIHPDPGPVAELDARRPRLVVQTIDEEGTDVVEVVPVKHLHEWLKGERILPSRLINRIVEEWLEDRIE